MNLRTETLIYDRIRIELGFYSQIRNWREDSLSSETNERAVHMNKEKV